MSGTKIMYNNIITEKRKIDTDLCTPLFLISIFKLDCDVIILIVLVKCYDQQLSLINDTRHR